MRRLPWWKSSTPEEERTLVELKELKGKYKELKEEVRNIRRANRHNK